MQSAKILIVEDDALVAYDLKQSLEESGYQVIDTVSTFDEVKSAVVEKIPDVVIMDINLRSQKFDGIMIAQYLLEAYGIHVIFLTAYHNDKIIQRAAPLNPHGYLLKPFDEKSLETVVKLALFKQHTALAGSDSEHTITLGKGYRFNPSQNTLFYEEAVIKLGKKEKVLLKLLLKSPGEIITFQQIENIVYSGEVISDSTIRTLIYRLRTKLEHPFIQTVNTAGCKWVPIADT